MAASHVGRHAYVGERVGMLHEEISPLVQALSTELCGGGTSRSRVSLSHVRATGWSVTCGRTSRSVCPSGLRSLGSLDGAVDVSLRGAVDGGRLVERGRVDNVKAAPCAVRKLARDPAPVLDLDLGHDAVLRSEMLKSKKVSSSWRGIADVGFG